MAPENEPVETIVQAHVEPAKDDEGAAEGEVSQETESEEGGEPEGGAREPKEKLVRRQPAEKEPEAQAEGTSADGELAEVDGETPRERALRLELTRMRDKDRKQRAGELLGKDSTPPVQNQIDPKRAEILKKYKPEEIQSLREVLPVLAEEMGYVRGDQLNAQTYNDKSQAEIDKFLESHPEYLPENDKDNVLWERLHTEFKTFYKTPSDPRDLRKILNRIHTDIFGIKVAGDGKGKQQAAQRKVQSAAHAGASAPTRAVTTTRPKTNTSGLRLDMLKGFTDEEKSDMTGE